MPLPMKASSEGRPRYLADAPVAMIRASQLYSPLSPFVRKVEMFLQLKDIECARTPVTPFALPEGYEVINPLKRIPALEVDGRYLADSAVICRFLEDLYPAPVLIPGDPWLKARIGWLEKFADYELAPAITATAFRHRVLFRSMGTPYDEDAIAAALAQTGGNKVATAKLLRISRAALYEKLALYGL